jgi:hypothetical protein
MTQFNLATYNGRIDLLASINSAKSYIEIGVATGATFFPVKIPLKVAVDPCFQFNFAGYAAANRAGENAQFFQMPSDKFFSMLKAGGHGLEKWLPFDVIFIDGLHTFEQSLRDFENSLNYAHDNTLWLIDDTVPCDAYSALPNCEMANFKRKRAGLQVGPWHGDVYKTIFAIHDKYPEISYCTLVSGNPQTILWRSKGNSRPPVFGSMREIDKIDYFGMLQHGKLLMPVEDGRLADLIGKPVNPMRDAHPSSWWLLITHPFFRDYPARILLRERLMLFFKLRAAERYLRKIRKKYIKGAGAKQRKDVESN